MGREIKRVPLTFDWSLNKTWDGFLSPDKFEPIPCEPCGGMGWSPDARRLHDIWYGNVPFQPEDNGRKPLRPDHLIVRALAERNVATAPQFYGTGERAIAWEARRLAEHWNGSWCHHLSRVDVAALLDDGRLRDFTHTWSREDRWQLRVPAVVPTPTQVNEWSLTGFGHDSSDAWTVIRARCERYGAPVLCRACDGECSFEAYPGQKAEAEAWEREEPPAGEGWQLWETVSEGSPISPVCKTAEALAEWMSSPAYSWGVSKGSEISYDTALNFITAGWAPTLVATPETGLVSGVEYVGRSDPDA